jgi:tRNA(fMet)-specific endonuclease VapC
MASRRDAGESTTRYMLDTDICSSVMRRSDAVLLKRLAAVPVSEVCMSVVTRAELMYGVEVSPHRAQDASALAAFLPYVDAIDFTSDAALHYADIRADLKRQGQLIGANDLFIAAHARCLGVTLVTNNTGGFDRVRGLKIQNWTGAAPSRLPRSRRSRSPSS